MDKILAWCTQDNINTVMSAIALFISVEQWIERIYKARESYKIDILSTCSYSNGFFDLFLCIVNCSDSPLVITSVKLSGVTCELEPINLAGDGYEGENYWITPRFPLTIASHGADYYYLAFDFDNLVPASLKPGQKISIKVQSTRREKEFFITLPDKFVKG